MQINIEQILKKFKKNIKKKYKSLEVDYYFNKDINTYELLFFGEEYEYENSFWKDIDSFVFNNFTLNDIYISYYYTDSFFDKIQENKKIIIESNCFEWAPEHDILAQYIDVEKIIARKVEEIFEKHESKYIIDHIQTVSKQTENIKMDYKYNVKGENDGRKSSKSFN